MMKTMVKHSVPLQSMEAHAGTDIHLQPVEDTPSPSRWKHIKEAVPLWEAHARAGSLQDL